MVKNKETEKGKKSKYAKVGGARTQRIANYNRPGHYLFRIDRVEEGSSTNNGDLVAIQHTVVKVFDDSKPGFDHDRKTAMALHGVGERCTDMLMCNSVVFAARLKTFACVAGDIAEEDYDANEEYEGENIDEMVGEDQPLAGTVVEVLAATATKKDARKKKDAELTGEDVFTRTGYVRRVPFAELKKLLSEEAIEKFFPDLDEQIAAEAAEATEGSAE